MSRAEWASKAERGNEFWVKVGFRLLNLLGYHLSAFLLIFVIGYFFLTGRQSRRASLAYLRRVFRCRDERTGAERRFEVSPRRLSWWHAYRHHMAFGLNVLDRMYFWQGRIDRFEFTWHGSEHLRERDEDRGMLLVGAHFGSFDAARALSLKKSVRINVVMYRAHAQKLNTILNAVGPQANLNVIELDSADIDKVFELKNLIEAGEIVAILADRLPPFGKARYCWIPFLGKEAAFPQNTWVLASLLECPVYFTAGIRTGWRRYHVFVEPLSDRVRLPRRERALRMQEIIGSYAARLEALCLRHPYQWFNFFPFWDDPDQTEQQRA
ncbi:Bacterial lipid A biosynthesis acyltransferase [Sulfidibacter corallicola]|uniref:Acyltransferase n=1 Tax=Sulfidibacter corallicola TaxID=2818388 RepID=A0A8A4TL15_SULCO|nr:hypothetical protein [Sulfidibacter corallicola]QTD49548.1 hypothetical protein J3U87_28510 [Sulfidibacter corallicola]